MTSASPAGAEMMTFLAPAVRCAAAASRLVKRPVDSITTSTPRSRQGSRAGSVSESTLIGLPSTTRASPVKATSPGNVPCTESYLKRWRMVAPSMRSLMATMSRSAPRLATARTYRRPIRPNPLMPTFRVMLSLQVDCLRKSTRAASPRRCGGAADEAAVPRGGRSCRPARSAAAATAVRPREYAVPAQVAKRRRRCGVTPPGESSAGQRLEPPQAVIQGGLGERRPGPGGELGQAQVRVLQPQGGDAAQRGRHGRPAFVGHEEPDRLGLSQGRPRGAPGVGLVAVGQAVGAAAHLAEDEVLLPGEAGGMGAQHGEQVGGRLAALACSRRRCARASRPGSRGRAAPTADGTPRRAPPDSNVNSACTADPGRRDRAAPQERAAHEGHPAAAASHDPGRHADLHLERVGQHSGLV